MNKSLPLLILILFIAVRINAQWSQQGPKLIGTGADQNSNQGISVAISSDGNTAVIGGNGDGNGFGAIWIFIRSNGVWTQQGSKLVGSGAVGRAWQGTSVAISSDGNTIIEGGPNDNGNINGDGIGAVWIFTRTNGIWTQQGSKIIGTGAVGNGRQGGSVAISSDGNTSIIGGYADNSRLGAMWVFTRSSGIWTQQGTKLVGSGAVGTQVYQGFSVSISADGNTAILGGENDNNGAGAIWVFTRSGGIWTQQGSKLVGIGASGNAAQGSSVTISADGNTIAEGGNYDNSVTGAIWIFTRSGNVWTQQGSKFIGTGGVGSSRQGTSVAISSNGSTFIEGGYIDNNQSGAVWIFVNPLLLAIQPISNDIPKSFSLSQNYPNPFNPSSKIKFDIPKTAFTSIVVFDILGREVSTLVNEPLQPGIYEINFDGTNLPSGVYFYRIVSGSFTDSKKMILNK